MAIKLFGLDGVTGDGGVDAGNIVGSSFICPVHGTVTELHVYLSTGGQNVSAGIYADNAGVPGALIVSGSAFCGGPAWNTIPITSTPVIVGTTYWLAFVLETAGSNSVYANAGKSLSYRVASGYPCPDPFGTASILPDYEACIAAYGTASYIGKIAGMEYATVKKAGGILVASIKSIGGVA